MKAFQINLVVVHGQCALNIFDEMLVANKKYLPQVASKIVELEGKSVTIKDATARELTEKGCSLVEP